MNEPVLADSSVWIASFREASPLLAELGRDRRLRVHPFVIGELALGQLAQRKLTLESLAAIRSVDVATHDEVLAFIEREHLYGRGIGYVDAHLLAACLITPGARLWTRDKSLAECARQFGVAANLTN